MIVLAIDLGTRSGWACGEVFAGELVPGTVELGAIQLPKGPDRAVARVVQAQLKYQDVIEGALERCAEPRDLVVAYESPGSARHAAYYRIACHLEAALFLETRPYPIEFVVATSGEWKCGIGLKGNAPKQAVNEWARGWLDRRSELGQDEADALGLAVFAARELSAREVQE